MVDKPRRRVGLADRTRHFCSQCALGRDLLPVSYHLQPAHLRSAGLQTWPGRGSAARLERFLQPDITFAKTEGESFEHSGLKHGNTLVSDSGRFAFECFVVQAQNCARLWCQHIFARGRVRRKSRSSKGVTCDGAFYAFYSGLEHILKQAFKANFAWTTISHLFA